MTTAGLDRSLPSPTLSSLRTRLGRVPAVTLAGLVGFFLAALGQILPAGVVVGLAVALIASDRPLRDTWLPRTTLGLLGVVLLGVGEALDWFGGPGVRWTLLLTAVVLGIALVVLQGELPVWRRATLGLLLLVALLPLAGVVPSLQVSLAVAALAMCSVGVLQQRR